MDTTDTPPKPETILLYLPSDLSKAELRQIARLSARSVNAQIIYWLRRQVAAVRKQQQQEANS